MIYAENIAPLIWLWPAFVVPILALIGVTLIGRRLAAIEHETRRKRSRRNRSHKRAWDWVIGQRLRNRRLTDQRTSDKPPGPR